MNMIDRMVARTCFALLVCGGLFGQSSPQPPKFDIADVHPSPRETWAKTPANNMQGGFLNGDRYEIRRATMLDLIKTAYAIDSDKIYGGPSWLDYDRFEIAAKTQPGTKPDVLCRMLQALLAERFGLSVKMDSRPLPAYVLTAPNGSAKLTTADPSGRPGCESLTQDFPNGNFRCLNASMEMFAAGLRRIGGSLFNNLPMVDRTGLDGTYDIDLHYRLSATVISRNGGPPTQIRGDLIEVVEKQLGLKLEQEQVPQPALVVENVNEQPSANPPGIETNLPPLPPPQFDVASVRLCDKGGNASIAPRFQAGGRVTATCMPVMGLIQQAWGLLPFAEIPGAPKWLSSSGTDTNISITAKAPEGNFTDGQGGQDRDALNAMMRALLMDRYKMKVHYEERPMDAFTLVPTKPKLTKADPANRTGCTRQTPRDRGDFAIRLTCQNITMAQFAEQILGFYSDAHYPVENGTGLDGAWDFTLDYDLAASLPALARRPASPPGDTPLTPEDPTGALSFADALQKQLGLKLEKEKRPERVLVIDHMEDKPTEN